ncbi:MAG: sodium/proline symporter [Thermoanaerobaculia bacterium]
MESSRPGILVLALGLLALTILVGIWAARRTRTAKDFFIAGQRVGLLVIAMATMSAAFSGFVFLGGPGLTYRIGVASLFIILPVGFTSGLLCWVVGRRLRLLASAREVYTIPDALECRYRSRLTSGLGALAVVVGTIGYLGAQILALGVVIEAIFGTREALGPWSPVVAMTAGMAVVLFYSIAGGMMAGVYTDLVQGGVMLLAAVAVFVRAIQVGGGAASIVGAIAGSDLFAGMLRPFGTVSVTTALGFFFVFGVGVLGQPHMLHKFYMLRDARQLKWMPLVLGASQTICLLIWVGVGLTVPALVAEGRMLPLDRPDDATMRFLLDFAPDLVAGLALAGALAAIMSTSDSFLNIGAAALVRDLPRLMGRPIERQLLWGRVATAAVAVAATGLALAYGDLIALLGTFAFGTLAAALARALAVGLNWPRVTATAATASIATGLGLNLTLELLQRQRLVPGLGLPLVDGVLPPAVALAGSFVVLFGITWLRGDPDGDKIDDDILAVMRS